MAKTVDEVLQYFKTISPNEATKGKLFERLMLRWLRTDPRYHDLFAKVWLWSDFPSKTDFGSGGDTGIDIVAKTVEGDYWAVQCKFYAPGTTISKGDVDSFLATSGRSFYDREVPQVALETPGTASPAAEDIGRITAFSRRLWIATTDNWNSNAEEAIRNQNPPLSRVSLSDLRSSAVDWEKLLNGSEGKDALGEGKQLRKHQSDAIAAALEYYKTHDRGKLIMACGTGKTFTSLRLAETMLEGRGLVLFMVPSIALLGQSLNDWCADAAKPIRAVCICSDEKVSRKNSRGGGKRASVGADEDDSAGSIEDLALPASTNAVSIAKQIKNYRNHDGLVVVFSTYQSIEAVAEAQRKILYETGGEFGEFGLIVCDEAHRTTGARLSEADESNFTKIHDNGFIRGTRRLYMTATPRLYGESAKIKASQKDCVLCSMDDEAIYGKEFFRVNFSYAVQNGILTDYKVLVLTVSEEMLPEEILKRVRSGEAKEVNYDDASRMIGVINALSKRILGDKGQTWENDPRLMRRAMAFTRKIGSVGEPGSSKNIAAALPLISEIYTDSLTEEDKTKVVHIAARHVDGSMGAMQRSAALTWIEEEGEDPQECRVITNVRCLSEGVDVPALDAVLFLSAKNSQVDVVQSVGRVMRSFHRGLPDEKKYGYIVIPVVVPEGTRPEDALEDNETFSNVWQILNALRAHDDHFNAHVNTIALNKNKGTKVTVGVPGLGGSGIGGSAVEVDNEEVGRQLIMRFGEQTQEAIFARLVEKCGDRQYWENWAGKVGEIARKYIERISRIVSEEGSEGRKYFDEFVKTLQRNLNSGVTPDQCIEMLAQHLITRPVFDALFSGYKFVENNSISSSMQFMVDILREQAVDQGGEELQSFFDSVRVNVGKIDNLEGKQTVIKNLYEQFFKKAFPQTVETLGVVYTPVECVDFIIRSVDEILRSDFGTSLSGENVHILDPFVGTGTFITRLLQSGVIRREDMARKYTREIHCNEIVLLAYYIADVNIESVFQECCPQEEYLPYNGICLTDTFQLGEDGGEDKIFKAFFKENSEEVERQRGTPIRVIIGNPPYSVGQGSANDNAQNQHYPRLEARIADTYAAHSKVSNKNSLYDSYIKAFRWAGDRISPPGGSEEGDKMKHDDGGGIVAFISNGAWIDGNAQDGMRACLEKEFDKIYVFNLRGNQRTSGELSRREGGKIFGSGSRTPIAITFLVKYPHGGSSDQGCEIWYHDIGDYLSRREKLDIVKDFGSIASVPWVRITPNSKGDWINQRGGNFDSLILLGDKKDTENSKTVFEPYYSRGLATTRDAFCYNSSLAVVQEEAKVQIDFYNSERERTHALAAEEGRRHGGGRGGEESGGQTSAGVSLSVSNLVARDSTKLSWSRAVLWDVEKGKEYNLQDCEWREALYRPFFRQHLLYYKPLNEMVYQLPRLFPTAGHENLLICVCGIGVTKEFSCIITDTLPDLELIGKSQCFPLWWYEEREEETAEPGLFDALEGGAESTGEPRSLAETDIPTKRSWKRHDGITDWFLAEVRGHYVGENSITKEDIFYYVYGLLHSPQYRETFANDLRKSLPRIPIVDSFEDFLSFSRAGRALAALHLGFDRFPSSAASTSPHQAKASLKGAASLLADGCPSASSAAHIEDRLLSECGVRVKRAGSWPDESLLTEEELLKWYRVDDRMRFGKTQATPEGDGSKGAKMPSPSKDDKSRIIFSPRLSVENIPAEAYDYVLNGKSAIEWLMERFAVTMDKKTGIRNDANDWAREHDNPRYILDVLLGVISLSLKTRQIVSSLPSLSL